MRIFLYFLRNWLFYLAALAGMAAFAYQYTGWFGTWMFLCTCFLPLLSLILALPSMLSVHLHCTCPETAVRGERADLTAEATGGRLSVPLPVLLHITQENRTDSKRDLYHVCDGVLSEHAAAAAVREQTDAMPAISDEAEDRQKKQNKKAGREKKGIFRHPERPRLRITLDTAHCGLLRTTVKGAHVTDFLGLFCIRVRIDGRRSMETLVLPRTETAVSVPDPWKRNGCMTVPAIGFSEQQEIRGYRPGDAMRSVHWKLSAKTDDVLVREGVEPERKRIGLSFDRTPDKAVQDAIFDCMDGVLRLLLCDIRTAYVLTAWKHADGGTDFFCVRRQEELPMLYRRLFAKPSPRTVLTEEHILHDAVLKRADSGYHISQDNGGISVKLSFSGVIKAEDRLSSDAPTEPDERTGSGKR